MGDQFLHRHRVIMHLYLCLLELAHEIPLHQADHIPLLRMAHAVDKQHILLAQIHFDIEATPVRRQS